MTISPGLKHEVATPVTENMTAEHFGNAGIPVLATPCLVGLVESACIQAIAPFLEPGQGSVGTLVEIRHLAATPVGLTVTLTAEVTAVEGRALTFQVTGHDGQDAICVATHQRAVISVDRFLDRVRAKNPS